ncbi:MAG: STAS domain-containing protein, partial [Terrimicrobiaceae bacterium]|nr:STAS domain-containing protein [Terrimicrobiaceae bacterium]
PLESAVFAGVLLSIVILLRVTGKPDLTQLVQHPDYGFEEVPFNRAAPSPVAIINLEGDLYFAAAEDLDYELLQALRPETRVVVLRMKRLRAVGSSAMAMLEHFHKLLKERGIHLIVCGVEEDMTKVLTGSGVRKLIGEQNIFYADNRIFQSTELALARAMSIVEMHRARSEKAAEAAQKETLVATTAAEVMQKKCLRFGDGHQVREAMWLVSQLQQRMGTSHPQTVFLQDREGRLSAEVTLRAFLRHLAAAVPEEEARDISDEELARLVQPRLFNGVGQIARHDPVALRPETPLNEAFARAARHGFRPMPVTDSHERLVGIFDEMAMLRGLTRLVQAEQREREAPPQPSEEASARPRSLNVPLS